MPRGPSHSSSGGSSSGGGSFSGGGGFGGHGGFRHHGSTVVFVGGGRSSFAVTWIFFIIFVGIFCLASIWGVSSANANINENKELIAIYETDAEWYYDAIEKANNGVAGYYTATATFNEFLMSSKIYSETNPMTGAYEYYEIDGYAYYFIVYEYYNTVTKQTQKGETYTCFTSSQIYALNEKIEIVYTQEDGYWYSINKNYNLKDNQDYFYAIRSLDSAKSGRGTMIVLSIVLVCVEILIITLFIKKIIKKSKEEKEKPKYEQVSNTEQNNSNKLKTKKCSYCGTNIPQNEIKCPNCGATKFDD